MIELIPAIDIIGGQCVRLTKGDYAAKKTYDAHPEEVARRFYDMGVRRLHVVDLDGAKDGTLANFASISAIAKQGGLYIEVGGGIRTEERIQQYLELGVGRCIRCIFGRTDGGELPGVDETEYCYFFQ